MKTGISLVVALSALIVAAASTQAQDWSLFGNYTDVSVYEHFDLSNNSLGVNADVNTWSSPTSTLAADRINAYFNDNFAANLGGFVWYDETANPGGGADHSYGGDLYFYRSDYDPIGSPDGYTRITGLTPGQNYSVAMFAVQGGTKDTVSTSLDLGATWSSPIDTPVIESMLGNGADWLAHSTTDAIGTPGVKDGDTRYRIIIGNQVADAAGEVIVGFRDPNLRSTGGSSDRGRIDGFAVAAVPEPIGITLAGLGAAALLIFRRRF